MKSNRTIAFLLVLFLFMPVFIVSNTSVIEASLGSDSPGGSPEGIGGNESGIGETDIGDPGEDTTSIDETDDDPHNDSVPAKDRLGYAESQEAINDFKDSILGKVAGFFGVTKELSIDPETATIGTKTSISVSISGVAVGLALGPLGFIAGPVVSAIDRSLDISVVDVTLGDTANPDRGFGSFDSELSTDPFGSLEEGGEGGDYRERREEFLNRTSPTPQIIFTADKTLVPVGGSATLFWEAQNANRCEAESGTEEWLGERDVRGEFIVENLEKTKVFSIRCFGPGGERGKSLLVATPQSGDSAYSSGQVSEVDENGVPLDYEPVPPELTLVVKPSIVESGGRVSIIWLSTGTIFCTAHDDWPLPQFPLKDGKFYKRPH